MFQTSNMNENSYFALQRMVYLLSSEDCNLSESQGCGYQPEDFKFDFLNNTTSKEYQGYNLQKKHDVSSFHRWYSLAADPSAAAIANYVNTREKLLYNQNIGQKVINTGVSDPNPNAGWYSVKLKYLFPQLFFM